MMSKSAVSVVVFSFQTFRARRGFISRVTSTLESYRIRIVSFHYFLLNIHKNLRLLPFLFPLYFVIFHLFTFVNVFVVLVLVVVVVNATISKISNCRKIFP